MARNFSARRRGPTSTKSWGSTNDGIKAVPLSGSILLGAAGNTGTPLTFVGTPPIDDLTVLRTRGHWQAQGDAGMATGSQIQVSVSLGVIPGVAGQTVFPTPIVDADWDGWFLHETIMLGIASSGGQDVRAGQSMEVDSKAMRKLNGGSSLIASFDAFNIAGVTVSVDFAFWARFLFKVG